MGEARNETYEFAVSVLCGAGGGDVELVWSCVLECVERGECTSIVVFVQVFSDTIETMLKNTALVVYPVYAVLLNSSALYRRGMIENELTFVGLLPAKIDICMERELIVKFGASLCTTCSLGWRRCTRRK